MTNPTEQLPIENKVYEIRYHENCGRSGIIAFFNSDYDHSKIPAIKQAIEKVLNGDIEGDGKDLPKDIDVQLFKLARDNEALKSINEQLCNHIDYLKKEQQPFDKYSIYLTKGQLDGMMENVFNAAREVRFVEGHESFNIHYRTLRHNFTNCSKYQTFKDYQSSLPENKNTIKGSFYDEQQPVNNPSTEPVVAQKEVLFTTGVDGRGVIEITVKHNQQ